MVVFTSTQQGLGVQQTKQAKPKQRHPRKMLQVFGPGPCALANAQFSPGRHKWKPVSSTETNCKIIPKCVSLTSPQGPQIIRILGTDYTLTENFFKILSNKGLTKTKAWCGGTCV